MLQFFIPLKKIPTATAQQKQVRIVRGKPIYYDPENVKKARALFEAHLAPHAPKEPLQAPVHVMMKWLYPTTQKKGDGVYKTTRPDVDNMQKIVLDSMTKLGFWKDDSHVSSMVVEKFHSDTVGIYFEVMEL